MQTVVNGPLFWFYCFEFHPRFSPSLRVGHMLTPLGLPPDFYSNTDLHYRDEGFSRTYLLTFHVLPFEHLTWRVSFDFREFPFLDLETKVMSIQNK